MLSLELRRGRFETCPYTENQGMLAKGGADTTTVLSASPHLDYDASNDSNHHRNQNTPQQTTLQLREVCLSSQMLSVRLDARNPRLVVCDALLYRGHTDIITNFRLPIFLILTSVMLTEIPLDSGFCETFAKPRRAAQTNRVSHDHGGNVRRTKGARWDNVAHCPS